MSLDPRLKTLLEKYGETKDSVWNCHGTWVAYHAAVERMAAKAGITFDKPDMIETNGQGGIVTVCVSARMGDKSEWSFGEVSPKNNKNSYPYAMAEKRAKDRVALKLLGMAGLVYSEEEADDFKEQPASEPPAKSSAQLKRDGEWEKVTNQLHTELLDIRTERQLDEVMEAYRSEAKQNGWSKAWLFQLADIFEGKRSELKEKAKEAA